MNQNFQIPLSYTRIPLSHTTAKDNQKVVYTTFSGKCITLAHGHGEMVTVQIKRYMYACRVASSSIGAR